MQDNRQTLSGIFFQEHESDELLALPAHPGAPVSELAVPMPDQGMNFIYLSYKDVYVFLGCLWL